MTKMESLFVEFNVSSINELINVIANLIDWYTEMLFDDPWNTWAQVKKDSLTILLNQIMSNGSDWDIDSHR